MRFKKASVSLWLAALVITLFSLSVTHSVQGEDALKVRVGYAPVITTLPLYIGLDKGYFKERGLELTLTKLRTAEHLFEALVANRIDVVIPTTNIVAFRAEQKSPGLFKIFVISGGERNRSHLNILVKEGSGITEIAQLKGKTIGIHPGTYNLIVTKKVLEHFSIDPDQDVKLIPFLPPPVNIESLESGRIDALVTLEPITTMCVLLGVGEILVKNADTKFVMDPCAATSICFSTKFLKENPETAVKFKEAFYKSLDWMDSHDKGARLILSKYIPITEEAALKFTQGMWWKISKDTIWILQKAADFYYENGLIEKKLNVADFCLKE